MEHYYSENPKSAFVLREIKYTINNHTFTFKTAPGIFSWKEIDKGSELLLKNAIMKENYRILDFGCGYGFIGVILAKLFPKSYVVMTEINKRACRVAEMNIKLNSILNAEVRHGDLYAKVYERFDTILVNPPQTAGKEICYQIIAESEKFLKKDGMLQLVARHNTGGSQLEKKMLETFGNVKDIAKKGGFRVYASKKE
jgi:16S rRNA G1207 methylase RsmC